MESAVSLVDISLDTPEDIGVMIHYLMGVRDMVQAWDDSVNRAKESVSRAHYVVEDFGTLIEEIREQLDGVVFPD